MKTLLTTLLLLCTAFTLRASVDPYDVVVIEDGTNNTILFRTTIPVPHDGEFQLVDANKVVLYRQAIAAGTYLNKRIRGAGMPNGELMLVLTDAIGRTEIPFHYSRRGLRRETDKGQRLVFPTVDLRNERLLVVKYPNESGKRVNVRLVNQDGEQVFADQLEGESIRRSYQLDQLAAGNYTVTVSSRSVKNYTAAIALR